MRIIAGKYRRLQLKSLDGLQTRPTLDRIRESFFSKIGPMFDGDFVLDLFAGSGSIGFEALSRGTKHVILNDRNPAASRILKENALHLKADPKEFTILNLEALKAIEYCLQRDLKFDWIYLDPPYDFTTMNEIFVHLQPLLAPNGKIYYEKDLHTPIEEYKNYNFFERYSYPRTEILVYQLKSASEIIE